MTPDGQFWHDRPRPDTPPAAPPPAPPVPPVPPLAVDDAREWSHHVPGWLLRAVVLVCVVACIGFSIAADGEAEGGGTAELIASPAWTLEAVVQSTFLASGLLVFLAPTVGTVVAAVCGFAIAASPTMNADLPGLWGGAATAMAVLAAADGLVRTRRRALVHTWRASPTAVVLVPEVSAGFRSRLLRLRGRQLLAAAASLAIGVGGLALFGHDAAAVAAFRADSAVTSTTVEAVVDDWAAVTVTIDGERYRVPAPSTYPEKGDVVEVRYQPATGRAELTQDVFDPTLAIIPAAAGLLAGGALLEAELRRRRRTTALLTHGGAAHRMRATWSADGAVLHAEDDVTRPVAVAPDLHGEDDGEDGAHDADPADPAEDPVDRFADTPVSEMSDAELLSMARALAELAEEATDAPAPEPPGGAGAWVLAPVVVVGLAEWGAPVALRDADGAWYVTATGPAPAARFRMPRLPGRAGVDARPTAVSLPAPDVRGGWSELTARRDAVLESVARRTGRWAPWLAVPVVAWVVRWMSEGTSLLRLLPVWLFCAGVGWTWSLYGQVRLELEPRWLRVRGRLLDELVAWRRIRSVVADDDALVVRLSPEPRPHAGRPAAGFDGPHGAQATDGADEEDALLLGAIDGGPPLTRTSRDPHVVADRLLRARHDRRTAEPPRLRHRPATPALVAAVWLAVAVAGAVTTR